MVVMIWELSLLSIYLQIRFGDFVNGFLRICLLKTWRSQIRITSNLLSSLLFKLLMLVMSRTWLGELNLLRIYLQIRFSDFVYEVVFILNDRLRSKIVDDLIGQVSIIWFYMLSILRVGLRVINLVRFYVSWFKVILVILKKIDWVMLGVVRN